MAASAASDSKTMLLSYLSLAWVLLRSWTLRMCLSVVSLLLVGSGITISVLVHNYVLISWPRAIPNFWTTFSYVVGILSAELFSPYVYI